MKGVKVREYDNGFELRYVRLPINTIFGSLVVNAGAGIERPHEYGISHFIEHTVCIGGTNNNSPEETELITSQLGDANAFTAIKNTSYVGSFLPDNLGLFLDYIGDVTQNAMFDPNVVEQERKAILNERMEKTNDSDYIYRKAFQESFYSINPMRRDSSISIIGPEDNIKRINRVELKDFHRRFTKRSNMTLYLTGPLPDDIETLVERKFCEDDGIVFQHKYLPEPRLTGIRRDGITRKDSTRTSVGMAWQVPSEELYDESLKLRFLTGIVQGDFTSGLFRELRRNEGLVYGVSAGYDSNFGEGMFYISTNVEPGKEDIFEDKALQFILKLQRSEVDEPFMERQKGRNRLTFGRYMDNPEYCNSVMFKEKESSMSSEDVLKLFERIQKTDVVEAAQHLDRERYLLFKEEPE